jgi:hypothetical protein
MSRSSPGTFSGDSHFAAGLLRRRSRALLAPMGWVKPTGEPSWRVSDRATDTLVTGFDATVCS